MMNPKHPAETAMHVSLVGSHEASMTDALDDALQKLAAITPPPGGPITQHDVEEQPTPRVDRGPSANHEQGQTKRLIALIDEISSSASRVDAMERVVDFLSGQFPNAAVRCASGTHRLSRLYDARLGWLGAESSVRDDAESRWETLFGDPVKEMESDAGADLAVESSMDSEPNSDAETHSGPEASCDVDNHRVELKLPNKDGVGNCVIWVEGEGVNSITGHWLATYPTAIANVFWSRPARSWPSLLSRVGQKYRIALASVAVAILAIAAWPVHYRVACKVKVDTLKQRLVATPFEASLLESNVKPGDTVKRGDVLARFDGRPLRIERESIESEIQQAAKERNAALASGRIADAQQAKLKRQQLERRHQLLTDRLQRLAVVSPIDGVIVSGDLEKHIGTPLKLGQKLMEVAPMDYMMLEVEIPEHEIGFVSAEADTRIKIDAIGGPSMQMQLDELLPAAELREEQNVFVGRIRVDNQQLSLRPGMRGDATVYGPLRPWIWSWARTAVERTLWWVGY